MTTSDQDRFFSYLKEHQQSPPPAPARERDLLLAKTRALIQELERNKKRSWIYILVPALTAATMMLVLWKGKPKPAPPPTDAEIQQLLYDAFQYELSDDTTEEFSF